MPPLASNGTEYTDYVYCNQYSAVAESRALDGSKTYDGYYLSLRKAISVMKSTTINPLLMQMNPLMLSASKIRRRTKY